MGKCECLTLKLEIVCWIVLLAAQLITPIPKLLMTQFKMVRHARQKYKLMVVVMMAVMQMKMMQW